MLKDNVLLKEIPRALVFHVQFCLPEVSSAGEFENFSMFRWLLLLFFVFCFFRSVLFSFFFFFVSRGKSSVSSL